MPSSSSCGGTRGAERAASEGTLSELSPGPSPSLSKPSNSSMKPGSSISSVMLGMFSGLGDKCSADEMEGSPATAVGAVLWTTWRVEPCRRRVRGVSAPCREIRSVQFLRERRQKVDSCSLHLADLLLLSRGSHGRKQVVLEWPVLKEQRHGRDELAVRELQDATKRAPFIQSEG